jgi:hypothetical protein
LPIPIVPPQVSIIVVATIAIPILLCLLAAHLVFSATLIGVPILIIASIVEELLRLTHPVIVARLGRSAEERRPTEKEPS